MPEITPPYPIKLDEGISDVAIDGTPADNELLAYDAATGTWINQTAAEAGIGAGGLANVVEDLTPQLGGDLDAQDHQLTNCLEVQAGAANKTLSLYAGGDAGDVGPQIYLRGQDIDNGSMQFYTPNATADGVVSRLKFSGTAATAVATWSAVTHTGIVLSGALDANGQAINGISQVISDNSPMTVDQADAADNDYAKFTANGLEGRSYTEVKQDLDLEIGTDVLAQQAIGIADNNLLEVDDAAAADNDFAVFTANGIEGLSAQTALSTLLAQVLLENDSVKLDPALSADGKWNGITVTGTAGATLAFGDIVYFAVADSRWELAKADAAATSFGKIGICVLAAAADGSATNILLYGNVRADTAFPALTIGAPVFISAATAGDITSTAPTGTTNFVVRIVGYGNTADELFFCPDNTYIELA